MMGVIVYDFDRSSTSKYDANKNQWQQLYDVDVIYCKWSYFDTLWTENNMLYGLRTPSFFLGETTFKFCSLDLRQSNKQWTHKDIDFQDIPNKSHTDQYFELFT